LGPSRLRRVAALALVRPDSRLEPKSNSVSAAFFRAGCPCACPTSSFGPLIFLFISCIGKANSSATTPVPVIHRRIVQSLRLSFCRRVKGTALPKSRAVVPEKKCNTTRFAPGSAGDFRDDGGRLAQPLCYDRSMLNRLAPLCVKDVK
jgi:hypothetical protein